MIVVVWTRGAFGVYTQAVANTRVVGAVIANMVNTLHSTAGVDFGNVHLVGHSLGAQVCGYAGERLPGLGRITGNYIKDVCIICFISKACDCVVNSSSSYIQYIKTVQLDCCQIKKQIYVYHLHTNVLCLSLDSPYKVRRA